MKNFLLITAQLFLIACSSADQHPGYTVVHTMDATYECQPEDCGQYPELETCGDGGTVPEEIRCLFIEDYGCEWIITKCYETDKGF